MKTLEELADTLTTTSGIDEITPEVWSDVLEKTAVAKRVARNFVRVNTDLRDKGGDVLHLPVANYSAITAAATTEGTDISTTALDYAPTISLTPAEIGAAVRISKDVVEEVRIDILRDATDQLA